MTLGDELRAAGWGQRRDESVRMVRVFGPSPFVPPAVPDPDEEEREPLATIPDHEAHRLLAPVVARLLAVSAGQVGSLTWEADALLSDGRRYRVRVTLAPDR